MKQLFIYILFFFSANILIAQKNDSVKYTVKQLLFKDDFNKKELNTNWITEYDLNEKDAINVNNKKLVINTKGGFTAWYKNKLSGNILIEYDRTVIMDSGKNDRLSDLNQFWMATDPQNKMFTRKGGFKEYDSLQMYYVGMGGNYNTTTRMRKYSNGNLKIVGEFTDVPHLLQPNKKYHFVQ